MKNKNWGIGMFLSSMFISCFSFPVLNITKEYSKMLLLIGLINILTFIFAYRTIGKAEEKVFAGDAITPTVIFNFLSVVVGMVCRYLLEFGEVSNTYNFTLPNMILHIVSAVGLASLTWMVTVKKNKAN